MNETEKRLRIYRALTTNPEWVEILQDALALQEKKEAEYAQPENTLGSALSGLKSTPTPRR